MCTRSQRPSFNQYTMAQQKKKNQTDDADNAKDDIEMIEEAKEYILSFKEIDNQRKMRKKVKPRNPMPQLMKKEKPKQIPYQRKEVNMNGIRLEKLSFGTLRRYQYFFKLDKLAG